jgi:hypothetical protein
MNQKTKEKIKQYLEVTVYLSLSITIITGIFIFTFMLPILTLKDVIIYFTILGILIIASAYFMRKDKLEV